MNIKMVKIDPKSLDIKSLKISASQVLPNKSYSNLEMWWVGLRMPGSMVEVRCNYSKNMLDASTIKALKLSSKIWMVIS